MINLYISQIYFILRTVREGGGAFSPHPHFFTRMMFYFDLL